MSRQFLGVSGSFHEECMHFRPESHVFFSRHGDFLVYDDSGDRLSSMAARKGGLGILELVSEFWNDSGFYEPYEIGYFRNVRGDGYIVGVSRVHYVRIKLLCEVYDRLIDGDEEEIGQERRGRRSLRKVPVVETKLFQPGDDKGVDLYEFEPLSEFFGSDVREKVLDIEVDHHLFSDMLFCVVLDGIAFSEPGYMSGKTDILRESREYVLLDLLEDSIGRFDLPGRSVFFWNRKRRVSQVFRVKIKDFLESIDEACRSTHRDEKR